jgi:hypothetical protein
MPFFRERSAIMGDRRDTLAQEITYNLPGTLHDAYNYELKIFFLDTALAKQKRVLDLDRDTAIVKVLPLFWSAWVPDVGINTIHLDSTSRGTIEIKEWNKDEIKLKENINVYDSAEKKKRKFKGVRTFRSMPLRSED